MSTWQSLLILTMWQKLFSGPWPEPENLLPPAIQRQAAQRIRVYWRAWGWQLVLGELVLWVAAIYQQTFYPSAYGAAAMMILLAYLLGMFPRFVLGWLVSSLALFLAHGMLINGLGAVTALSFLMPYTFAGMLLSGRRRVFVQMCCTLAFWFSLIYEVAQLFPQLYPPGYILVGYNILLAAFTFQTLRFLNQLAVEMNTAYVAEEIQQRSQQLLARVSHELRTPLGSVMGFAKLLRRAELAESHRRYLEQIIEESEQLNRLVSDLLDSAHLATGKVTLNPEPCDVNALCAAVAEEHRPNLPPPVALKLALAPQLPTIEADRVRLRQAVGNLVSNAIKYTEAGSITLRTGMRDGALRVEVEDTGIGIPEAQQKLIFTPFVQLDARRIGVGLGLDIARQIVRLHGGDIRVQSAPGQGSTFTVELPLAP
ncbi:MAG: HAMP domain-containing histidine kinase [Anaerolineae bacterium]|nr:HAMP domain-containing histidine kinase [Anaerolineae bacterium]